MRTPPAPALLLALALAASGCRGPAAPPPVPPGPPGRTVGGPATVADSTAFTTGEFRGCPQEGDGGDPDLNRLKNRDRPPPAYADLTIAQIVGNRAEEALAAGRSHRSRWPTPARDEISRWENTGVRVVGYLQKVTQQGLESCNCHAGDQRDFHLWIAEGPNDDRSNSLVVEVSPRVQSAHDNWRLRILQRLARDRAQVRISGWLMWDQEHPEQIGQTRGTLWEIHPIHKIEVQGVGGWREL
jgi:hypothetical protein